MREYQIVAVDLWFILKKLFKDEDWKYTTILYWNGKYRDSKEESAKTYYFRDDAIGHLIFARKCWWNEPC